MAKKRDEKERIEFLFDNEEEPEAAEIDLFADDDSTDDLDPSYGEEEETPAPPAPEWDAGAADGADKLSDAERAERLAAETAFAFDRYGRRTDKRKKSRYGKRKNAPKAATKVVQNDTIARREMEAAKARSRQRAAKREAKEARERRIREQQRKARLKSNLTTAGIGIGSVLILLVMGWFTTRIRTINIEPVPSGYTVQEILDASKLKYGRSIVFTDLNAAKENIEKDAYLRATVRYTFPSTVTVQLEQRTAAACVRWGPQNEYLAIIDSAGTVLNAEAETTGGLIVVEGMSITTAQNGRPIGSLTDLQVAGLIRILQQLEELDLLSRTPRLVRIDMSELMSISIATEGTNYSIEVGDTSNLDTKFRLLQKHWSCIMDTAARYIQSGYATATIYLYSRGGVAVSPYEPGYNAAMQNVMDYTLPTDDPNATPNLPNGADNPPDPDRTPDPDTPVETPPPTPTAMPHQGGSFTG